MILMLDTDVLIECLRGQPSARAWVQQNQAQPFQVPGIVAMELGTGCQNQAELRRVQQFLQSLNAVWPEPSEFARAYDLLSTYRLSTGLSIPDSLIAAMALSRSARLHTFNLKHFRSISQLDVQAPYFRS